MSELSVEEILARIGKVADVEHIHAMEVTVSKDRISKLNLAALSVMKAIPPELKNVVELIADFEVMRDDDDVRRGIGKSLASFFVDEPDQFLALMSGVILLIEVLQELDIVKEELVIAILRDMKK